MSFAHELLCMAALTALAASSAPTGVAVGGDPQVLGCKNAALGNAAGGRCKQQRRVGGHQLECHRLACRQWWRGGQQLVQDNIGMTSGQHAAGASFRYLTQLHRPAAAHQWLGGWMPDLGFSNSAPRWRRTPAAPLHGIQRPAAAAAAAAAAVFSTQPMSATPGLPTHSAAKRWPSAGLHAKLA